MANDVHVMLNFSEHRAVCQGKATGPFDSMLCSATLQQEVAEPPLKKARMPLALCYGSPGDPQLTKVAAGTAAEEDETSEADAAAGGRSNPGSPVPAEARAVKDFAAEFEGADEKRTEKAKHSRAAHALGELEFVPPAGA